MTFQPPSRSFTTRDYLFITLIVILFVIVSTGLVSANLTLKQGGDFYVDWVAARGFVFDRTDPYSAEVPARTQQLVYGDAAKAGTEPYILDTPFQILLLYFPFALLADPGLARAFYTLILELALFALAILSLRLTEWEAPRLLAVLFVLFAVLNFYSIQAIYEASPVLLLGLLYAGILYSMHNEMDEFAGALIAVSLYYWEVGAPFLFLVFLRISHEKRMRVAAGFFMVSLILFFISFLFYPGWIIPFLRATVNNLRAEFGFNIHSIFVHVWPANGGNLVWIFIASLILLLGYEWNLARRGDERRFYWAACLGLAVAPLLGFHTEMENLAVLVIPLALIFAIIHDRWRRLGSWLTFLLMLVVFGVPWMISYFLLDRFGGLAQDVTFLFPPLFTVLGLYWIRWWAIRPPRILSDLANRP